MAEARSASPRPPRRHVAGLAGERREGPGDSRGVRAPAPPVPCGPEVWGVFNVCRTPGFGWGARGEPLPLPRLGDFTCVGGGGGSGGSVCVFFFKNKKIRQKH